MKNCVIIEIGTTYSRGMVIEPRPNGQYGIICVAESENKGVKKSEIVNPDHTNTSIKTLIERLEAQADMEIVTTNILYSGGDLTTEEISGLIPVKGKEQIIEQTHIDEAIKNACEQELPNSRELIEDIELDYILDDKQPVENPIGMKADSLRINLMRLHVDKNRVNAIYNALDDNHVDYEKVYITGLCAALGATTQQQRNEGVLVIDFGGGTTNWSAYVNTTPRCVGSIPVGGDHITNDISYAFKLSFGDSEKIKKLYGSATIINKKQRFEYDQNYTTHTISINDFTKVINARIDETIRIVKAEVAKSGCLNAIKSVILCGNGAALSNLPALVSNIFQLPCAIASPQLPPKIFEKEQSHLPYISLLGAAVGCTKEAIQESSSRKSKSIFKRFLRG